MIQAQQCNRNDSASDQYALSLVIVQRSNKRKEKEKKNCKEKHDMKTGIRWYKEKKIEK